MINEALAINGLTGLVGFRNPTLSGYAIVDAGNQASSSGLYFQDGYKLVTIKNIKDTQEDVSISDENFNVYLENLVKSAIVEIGHKITREKSKVLETKTLYPYEQDFEGTHDPGTGGFVGIKIRPSVNDRLLLKVNAISAAFDSAITLPIYLINSETGEAIYDQEITTAEATQVRQNVDWYISLNRSGLMGGSYYLGYYTSDLSGAKPYKRNYELASAYTPSNNFYFEFRKNGLSGTRIVPDSYDAIEQPWGLNLNYSVYTDWTQKLIDNKYLLARALQLQVAEKVVEQILTSTRSNMQERLGKDIREIANFALEGNSTTWGLRRKLEKEINDLRRSFWPEPLIENGTLK